MEYKILGGTLPVAICKLTHGESLYTQSGGMGWMSYNLKMNTNIKGGLFKGITRKFMKQSVFMTTYTCTGPEGVIAFPSDFPGSIISFDLAEGETIIAQKSAFLFAETSVVLSLHIQSKPLVGIFGGEGFIMQKITGPGKVFLEVDGGSIKHSLKEGEILIVDPGHISSMTSSVKVKMKVLKGISNWFFSGEHLLLTELEGPGDVYLQTMPIRNIAKSLSRFFKPRVGVGFKSEKEDENNK